MEEKQMYNFFRWMFFLPLLPYISFLLPFLPQQIGPFNISGIAWLMMYGVVIYYMFAGKSESKFPYVYWLPWICFLFLYLLYEFTFEGLQLTLQYTLPFFVGITASRFVYGKRQLHWLFKNYWIATGIVLSAFVYGYFFLKGWTPMTATTPMYLSVIGALTIGVFYMTKKIIYLLAFVGLFLVPFADVTRMGIAVFLIIFIFHFANKGGMSKIFFAALGVLAVWFVFNSKGFQEKTFFGGRGEMTDISLNYYDPGKTMNTSGRSNFLRYYEPGLNRAPIMGNGPRADMYVLKNIWGGKGISEAHDDYLAVRYNYGYFGLVLLMFGFIGTFFDLFSQYVKADHGYRKLLQSSTMILTISFVVYMYSDNVLKTTVFFTDFYFALIGMSYAKIAKQS
jgi:hypothetical protein